jgi:hypothetical protein
VSELDLITSEDKEHAEYSASGSARWMNCPGSHQAAKLVPPLPESKYALEGTQAHACLELLLQNRANLVAAVKLASKTYPKDMIEHAVETVKYVEMRAAELPGSVILCEQKVNSTPFLGVDDQFGTLDISIVQDFGRLIVIDYKYGAGIAVDPREDDGQLNSQLTYYALALSHQYDHNFSEVELVVVQPRAWHPTGETIRSAVASMDELLTWVDRFKSAVQATLTSDLRRAGKWCKFCPVAIDCRELKDKSFESAKIAFSDSEGLTAPLPAPHVLPNLGTILDACDKLEDWIAKVRGHAMDVLSRGHAVEGYKLVEKRGKRKWIDADQSAAEAAQAFGDDAFTEPVLKSPAQIENTFGKAAKAWVEARVTTVVSGVTLAKADDKRPAVNGLDKVFGVLDV